MIAVTRLLVRRFRAVYRRTRIGKGPGSLNSQIIFRSGSDGLRIWARADQVALEYHQVGHFDTHELVVPADLLASCEGRSDDLVTLESGGNNKVLASWIDRGIPQSVECDTAQDAGLGEFPPSPEVLAPNSPELCLALQAAIAIVPQDRTRYALDCLELCGRDGKIVVTDGRQILVQSGFQFPWTDKLLVPASPAIASREFLREGPIAVGMTEGRIAFRVGPWTIWLRIEPEARFPKVDDLIRQPSAASSQLKIDPLDAEFLAKTLDRLPGDDAMNRPVTVDLNGHIAVRGRPTTATRPTELILSRSTLEGENVAVNMNREFLARALKLGFRDVCLFGPQAPPLCDDGRRQYLWALLDPDSVIRPCEEAIRIESATYGTSPQTIPSKPNRRRFTVSQMNNQTSNSPSNGKPRRAQVRSIAIDPSTSPIGQALAVRTALRETLIQTNELIRALNRDKRQNRLVATTLASLKQLEKVAG